MLLVIACSGDAAGVWAGQISIEFLLAVDAMRKYMETQMRVAFADLRFLKVIA